MPYVGRTPTPSPVTIDDIPANSIDASKIVDGSIEVSDIKDNSITDAKLNSTKLDGIADSANNYSHPAAHTVSEVTGLQGLLDGKTTETYVNTQVAALVASSPATLDTLNELATALGNDPSFATTVTNSIGTKLPLAGGTMTGDVSLGDNVKAKFGASDDLQIYHDSGNSVIQDNGVGDLYIMGESSIRLTNNNAVNHYAKFNNGGSVQLYHNNLSKLATTSTGVDVTGNVACDSLGVTGSTGSISLGGSGNNIDIGSGTGTQSAILNIGAGRTASGYAYIDLIGDTTYTDYGLRVMRENAGANAGSQISHRGTGSLALAATDGGNLIFNSAGEKMRINSAGNVGIGTTAPSVMLDIGASGKPGEIRVTNNVYDSWILQKRRSDNTQICGIKESGSGGLSFLANGERVRITSAGNVGIGTTSPEEKLHVAGRILAGSGAGTNLVLDDDTESAKWGFATGGYNLSFQKNNGSGVYENKMRILSDGTLSIDGPKLNLPTGTSDPSGAAAGSIYFNTTDNALKIYGSNGEWGSISISLTATATFEWKLPTNSSYVSGTLSADKTVFTAESNIARGYSGVIVNHVFVSDFEVIASWQHDYMGVGMVYGSAGTLTLDKFTGESTADPGGNYWGNMDVTGLNPTSVGTFFGQYHAPNAGNGSNTSGTKQYFKWARSGTTISLQYSTSSASGPWSNFSNVSTTTIGSSDVVIVGAGEASGTENDPLRLLSITGY